MSSLKHLLSTDELVKALNEPDDDNVNHHQKDHQRKKRQYVIFWGIVAFAVLHLFYLALPLMLGIHQSVHLLGHARVVGIPYVEGVGIDRPGQVIYMGKYDIDEIAEEDFVMVYGLLDTNYHFEVEITSINTTNQTFTGSYDGAYEITFDFEDIDGIYVRDVNGFGVFLYVLSQWRGLLATAGIYASIILVYYMFVYKEMKVIKKG